MLYNPKEFSGPPRFGAIVWTAAGSSRVACVVRAKSLPSVL